MPKQTLSAHFNALLQSGQKDLALEQLKALSQSLPDEQAKAKAALWLQEREVPWEKVIRLWEEVLGKLDEADRRTYALALGNNNIVLQKVIGSVINILRFELRDPLPHHLNAIPTIEPSMDCVGREAELEALAHQLKHFKKAVVLCGKLGIGKTTLAQAFVTLYQGDYKHLVWVEQGEDLALSVAQDQSLAQSLDLPIEEGADLSLRFAQVMQSLRAMPGPNLMVIDNATKKVAEKEIFPYLPKSPNWKVLAISSTELPDFVVMELEVLKPAAALAMFRLYYEGGTDEEVMALLEEIEFHTLMIELMAKTLKRKRGLLSVAKLLDIFRTRKTADLKLIEKIWTRHKSEKLEVFQHLMGLS